MEESVSQPSGDQSIDWLAALKASGEPAAEGDTPKDGPAAEDTNKREGEDPANQEPGKEIPITKEAVVKQLASQQSKFEVKLNEKDKTINNLSTKVSDYEAEIAVLKEENAGLYTDENGKVEPEKLRLAKLTHAKSTSTLAQERIKLDTQATQLKAAQMELTKKEVAVEIHLNHPEIKVEDLMKCKHPLEMVALVGKAPAIPPSQPRNIPKPPGAPGGGREAKDKDQILDEMYPTMK